jgi:hypothetical protein
LRREKWKDLRLFGRAAPARELTGREGKAEVLPMAIRNEKAAIAYFTGLTEFVLGEDNIEVIKDILGEEERHVRILTQSREQARCRAAGNVLSRVDEESGRLTANSAARRMAVKGLPGSGGMGDTGKKA